MRDVWLTHLYVGKQSSTEAELILKLGVACHKNWGFSNAATDIYLAVRHVLDSGMRLATHDTGSKFTSRPRKIP